jgi:hypothetical protein
MERLTDPGYIPERVVANMGNEQLSNIYKKLCSYESTGIDPNQICEIMAHNTALIERLADYEEAEEKGLSIILPCQIGDYVYWLDRGNRKIITKKVQEINVYIGRNTFSKQIIFETAGTCFSREFGTNAFLNKNEAEKALEAHLNRKIT